MSVDPAHFCNWQAGLQRQGLRQLIWLPEAGQPAQAAVLYLLNHLPALPGYWLSECAPAGLPAHIRPIRLRQTRRQLGQQCRLLIVDAHHGFNPDALAALSGTLTAGGVLFLLTPICWREFADPDYTRLAAWPFDAAELPHRFLGYCEQQLNCLQPLVWTINAPLLLPALPDTPVDRQFVASDRLLLTQDQQQVLQALLTGWAEQLPGVVTAHRGRGKSSVLGLAMARHLLRDPSARFVVTAPSKESCATLFHHLQLTLEEAGASWLMTQVRYQLPAELALTTEYLCVDEAAALPVSFLKRCLSLCTACVFTTTQQGYEGQGRGFTLRFLKELASRYPHYQRLTLQQPVRWSEQDPLEQQLNQLLLLDADLPRLPRVDAANVHIAWLDRAQLADNPGLLKQIFGLLILAHYRTCPDDVRYLLDAPGLMLAVAWQHQHPVGLALVQKEGGFPPALAQQIHYGQRRPQGHLLPQSLAFHAGWPQAAEYGWWRIQRLLVHPECQRRKLGTRLLAFVQAEACSHPEPPDLLGSSFGMAPELLAFWQQQDYLPLRLGSSLEPSTGEPAIQLGKALSPRGSDLLQAMYRRFCTTLPDQCRFLPAEVKQILYATWPLDTTAADPMDDLRELRAFACGHRPLEVTWTALRHWYKQQRPAAMDQVWQGLLYADWSLAQAVACLQVSGKKQLLIRLRDSVRQTLADME